LLTDFGSVRTLQGGEGNQFSDHLIEKTGLVPMLAKELADTFFYMVLLAERYEINLSTAIVDAFNQKSEAMGFPERRYDHRGTFRGTPRLTTPFDAT
jgi:hypothetical protein